MFKIVFIEKTSFKNMKWITFYYKNSDENGKTYACGVGIEGILGIGKLKNVNL